MELKVDFWNQDMIVNSPVNRKHCAVYQNYLFINMNFKLLVSGNPSSFITTLNIRTGCPRNRQLMKSLKCLLS